MRKAPVDLVTPEKVRHKLDSSEEVIIVDVPDLLDFEADPRTRRGQ
jgi:hypothetical protein